jgi:hypothetical protein
VKLHASNAAGAAADARRAVVLFERLPSRDGPKWFNLACARAALTGAAGGEGDAWSAESSAPADPFAR